MPELRPGQRLATPRSAGTAAPRSATSLACHACGRKNPPDLNFCPGCGVARSASAAGLPAASTEALGTQRRSRAGATRSGRSSARAPASASTGPTTPCLGREVAIALMKTDDLDDAGLERLRREAQAMARLGDNPNIVTVHDIGEDNGQPYIVSQHMQGGAVADLLPNAPGHRLPIDQVLSISQQVCVGLAHAHRHGIVHRDIKPANIWLDRRRRREARRLRARRRAGPARRLTVEGMIVGTLAYMPPELAAGAEQRAAQRPVLARRDGLRDAHRAVRRSSARTRWRSSRSTCTRHPSRRAGTTPTCPRRLEELVLALLAKEPPDRPASATDVEARAGRHQLIGWCDATVRPRSAHDRGEPARPPGRRRLRRPRATSSTSCARRSTTPSTDAATWCCSSGEPGIGKTRVADELATYASLRGAQVLWGRCYESEGAPVYWPWVQVIRSYVHERDDATLRSEMGTGAADIAQVVSNIHDRLPGLPSPPALEPEQARFRLFDSVATFLKNAARNQPLVLILDDLHSADEPSLRLLQFLARELRGAPLLVLATYRDMQLGPAPPALRRALAAGRRAPQPAGRAARPGRGGHRPLHRDDRPG